jgi:transposase InsO family protein
MSEVLDVSVPSLHRWQRRRAVAPGEPAMVGRPKAIPDAAAEKIRACYRQHYGQWGPQVMALWCRRQRLGDWSPSTIAAVIADLREDPEPVPVPIRYEITASQVMWSEDGAGFREEGCKKELLILQDEHARFKVNHRLVDGPASGEEVVSYLREAFERYGAPLVLKHDGGSIFHSEALQTLLAEYQVLDLTGPASYPQYNVKKERSVRDVKSYERAMRRQGVGGSLACRLDRTIGDLNIDRPRPVLGGRTAAEVFAEDRIELPDRRKFKKEVEIAERRWLSRARSRAEQNSARRKAIEEILLHYRFMNISGDVSRNYRAQMRTD